MMDRMRVDSRSLRRIVLLALVAGLSVAAVVAIAAILTRSFGRVDLRVVATSLGFSVFSVLGAAGAPTDQTGRRNALGLSTMAVATLSYGLLLVGIWVNHGSFVWRSFGTFAVTTLAVSHACLVLGNVRATDSPLIRRLTAVSVVAASVDSAFGGLAIVGAVRHVDSDYLRLLAVLVIVMLLTTVLPPLLRRLQRSGDTVRLSSHPLVATASAPTPGLTELLAIADHLDELISSAGPAATQIGSYAAQLRRIAHRLKYELPR